MNNPLTNGYGQHHADHYQDNNYHDLPNLVRRAAAEAPLHPQIPPQQAQLESEITNECANIAALLINKNRQYGNSALNPMRVFSRAPTVEQILVRIDDKLSRIRTRGPGSDTEDTVQDLIGYLILLRLAARGVA